MSSSIFCRRGALGCSRAHFNPRTPYGVRLASLENCSFLAFYISIHAPLAGCDLRSAHQDSGTSYFNPRTPCGVRRCSFPCPSRAHTFQSTHPSRGATGIEAAQALLPHISIHAPLTGCDGHRRRRHRDRMKFQSTHPLRGATLSSPSPALPATHFNPRTPCGVRRTAARPYPRRTHFNPRTPRGVRLVRGCCPPCLYNISIHAPLAGCDPCDLQ